jgi:Skp family chaperone for outer membrane proteins
MKQFLPLAVVAGILFGAPPTPVHAQTTVKIAVLDLLAIRLRSEAGKSISKQLGAFRKALQKDAEGEQQKLRTAQNELRLQRSLLSPEAMQARERRFRDDVAATQRSFQARKNALEKSRADANKIFEDHLTEVLKIFRKERKIDVIFKKRPAIIYAETPVDITEDVLKRLDARIKHIPVKKPGK